MAIRISDLPPKFQAQAMRKYMEQRARRGRAPAAKEPDQDKGTKYHNMPTERITADGTAIRFDSQKEARRFDTLAARLQAGRISDLRLQVDFTLQEAYTDANGHRVRAIRYKADFTYWEQGEMVVEDVKSAATRTDKYKIKRKLLKDRFGIDITEV